MELGAKPAGLGARDTLRLEMGYPLYGHELDENRNAAESGFSRAIAVDKEFIGSKTVCSAIPQTSRVCFRGSFLKTAAPDARGDAVLDENDGEIGLITSGAFLRRSGVAVALAYIRKDLCVTGARVCVRTGRNKLAGLISDLPFLQTGNGPEKII